MLLYSLNPSEMLGLEGTTQESTRALPLPFYFTEGEAEAQRKITYSPKVQ